MTRYTSGTILSSGWPTAVWLLILPGNILAYMTESRPALLLTPASYPIGAAVFVPGDKPAGAWNRLLFSLSRLRMRGAMRIFAHKFSLHGANLLLLLLLLSSSSSSSSWNYLLLMRWQNSHKASYRGAELHNKKYMQKNHKPNKYRKYNSFKFVVCLTTGL
jgi:hypothetical protein